MNTKHRYILEPYKGMKTRYNCPNCNKRDKTFSLYIDIETGKHIHPSVGRCSRESNCGYHYTPKQYFEDSGIKNEYTDNYTFKHSGGKCPIVISLQKLISFIPVEIFKRSLSNYELNNFVKFLFDLFGVEVTNKLISKYFIGTSKFWVGATVFWQIDITGKIRTGKIMLYSPDNGKRVKDPCNHINWVHKVINQRDFALKQCLFGEHLLKDISKPVAIVESEKTAIICSVYLPEFIWLAVGSLTNLNIEKCSVLIGRAVTLFPDLKGFEKWSNKAIEFSNLAHFSVSNLLESKAITEEKQQGLDLADYLLKYSYKEFISPTPESIQSLNIHKSQEVEKSEPIQINNSNYNVETNQLTAFVNSQGKLFVPTPYSDTYSIYSCIDDYNHRRCLPDFQNKNLINIQNHIALIIDIKTLTIKK